MLIVRQEAEEDIKQSFAWYEAHCVNLGSSFLVEVEKVFENIEAHPQLYASITPPIRRALCKRFPYVVYFIEQNADIVVLAVLHQRRRPSTWRNQIET